jgi:hypothetical protein
VKKTIGVFTNDPEHKQIDLVITGKVERFVTISTSLVRLIGPAGKPLTATVTIVPEKKYPFKILEAKAEKTENIAVKLESKPQSNQPAYLLTVQNLKKDKGRYFDIIHLKTDSQIRPDIKIRVFGQILDAENAVKTAPAQVQPAAKKQ